MSKQMNPQGKKQLDHQRLEKLYYDFKKNQMKKKDLLKNVEKEEGITFKPKLTETSYNPKDNFIERNEKFLDNKRINIEIMRKMEIEMGRTNIKYSQTEVESVVKNIEERLYKPAVKKQLKKSNLQENQFSKIKKLSSLNEEGDQIASEGRKIGRGGEYNFIKDLNSDEE